ncbi:hypothetical protein [Peribacillus sp. RS7]|uniref:hypothetical protein n=1 Tax=Peribacillus sp. RS7 TaxID=3242679 RepID=UPI0035C1F28D
MKEPVCILEAIITPANAEAAKPTYGNLDKMAALITLRYHSPCMPCVPTKTKKPYAG